MSGLLGLACFLSGCTGLNENEVRALFEMYALTENTGDEIVIENSEPVIENTDLVSDPPIVVDLPPAVVATDNDAFDLSKVTWLGLNVSTWAISTYLNVTIDNKFIHLDYNGEHWFPVANLSGNLWAIVNHNNKWYAFTIEWLRHDQKQKLKGCMNYEHAKRNELKDWKIKAGDEVYIFVSGLCRDKKRNVQERSNIVPLIWQ